MNRVINAAVAMCVVCVAVVLAGCGPKPASIEVTPASVAVNSADEAPTLTARVLDEAAQEIPNVQVAWTSSDPAVAAIDAAGKLAAKKSGEATVTVAAGEVKQDVIVKVALYTTIKIGEPEATLKVGEVKPVTAQIMDEAGAPIDGKVEWKSADEAVAKIDAEGKLMAVAAGKTTVTATAKALTANMAITVESPGPAQFKAAKEALELKVGKAAKIEVTAADAEGKPVEGVKVEWLTSDEKIATVSPEGECKAVAAGEATITAKAGDKTAAVKVTVK
jgi:uncharacterized protein YjdB